MQPLRIIKYALDSTISLINKGENPTSALHKTAKSLDLNPNYIQRTGEALNVALHYDHFKKASDRAADFDTADIDKVTADIFGEKEKNTKQKKAELFSQTSEDFNYNNYLTNPGFKKTAAAMLTNKTDNYDSYETSYKGQMKKAVDYMQRLERELDEIKTEKAAYDINVEASFFGLVNDFKKTAEARDSFHEFESRAFIELGERAMPYVDMVYKTAKLKEARGTHDPKFLPREIPSVQLNKLAEFLDTIDGKLKLAAELQEAETYIASQQAAYRSAVSQISPFAREKTSADELANYLEKEAFGEVTKSLVGELFQKFNDSATDKDQKSPSFKNTALDNRDRTMLLEELIMTDPILSKQDPHKIIQAYQQLLRIAPQVSKEKEIVRSELRSRLAGQAMHAVDAKQLVETNHEMLKQQKTLGETSGGGGDKK